MNVKKIFGRNLKRYRKNAGMTQEKLSEALGITPKHLSVIENGINFVSSDIIEKASSVLGVTAASFFYDEEERDGSESFMAKIDSLVEQELQEAALKIKIKMRAQSEK